MLETIPHTLAGRTYRRVDDGYEPARRAAVRNGRTPDRYPDLIVQAESDDDVVAAVLLARKYGMRIGIRSGGHSWAASFLRDGGLLLDLSRLREVSIDSETRTAIAQPGLHGSTLDTALRKHDLFFPVGHCLSVGLGGYLLQGGFGWNSRVWGPACASVRAMDVVTADGELVRADEAENSDLYWAARGAGPGFFGVVTRFHIALYPRPEAMMVSSYVYRIEALDEVLRWAREIQPSVPRTMELMVFVRRGLLRDRREPAALVLGPALADSEEEAIDALAILESCPVVEQAVRREVNARTDVEELLARSADFYPDERRYAVDNMWTHAPAEDLLRAMRGIAATLPAAPSHMMWMLWGPPQERGDMAFSVEDDLYIALYAIWEAASEDAAHQAWVTEWMRKLEPLATGIQLADENLGARPFRFLAEENLRRLDQARAKYDPEGVFHSFMGR